MVGSFGDVVFEISDKKVFSINNEIKRTNLKYPNIQQYLDQV